MKSEKVLKCRDWKLKGAVCEPVKQVLESYASYSCYFLFWRKACQSDKAERLGPSLMLPDVAMVHDFYNTTSTKQRLQHNFYNTTSTTQQLQHNVYNTTTQRLQHNVYNTTSTTQRLQHNIYNTTSTTQHLQHNIYTTSTTASTTQHQHNVY